MEMSNNAIEIFMNLILTLNFNYQKCYHYINSKFKFTQWDSERNDEMDNSFP